MNHLISQLKNKYNQYFKADNLQGKAVRGGILLGSANVIEQGSRFIRNIILTRILTPDAFGVMAIVLAINNFLESFTEVGIRQALIQHPKGHDELYLHGAWWIGALRSVILYTIAFIASPFIADFYNDPDLVLILRIAFLSILFKGLMSIRVYVEIKDIRFKYWSIISHGGGIIGILTAIVLAFMIRNIWALVIGFTVESAARLLLSYIFCPYMPRLKFKKEYMDSLIKYALGMLGLPILTFVFMRADIFVIGKLCTQYDLGLYSMAVALAMIPVTLISKLISEVALPAFSKMQDDHERMNKNLIDVTNIITHIAIPLLILVYFYGEEILSITYGAPYAAVAIPFAIVTTTTVFRLCSIPIVSIYLAKGKPSLHRFFVIIRAVIIMALIYPAVKDYGLVGGAGAGLIALSVGLFFQVRRLKKLTDINLWNYGKVYISAFTVSMIIIVFWALQKNLLDLSPAVSLALGLISCCMVYAIGFIIIMKLKKA